MQNQKENDLIFEASKGEPILLGANNMADEETWVDIETSKFQWR